MSVLEFPRECNDVTAGKCCIVPFSEFSVPIRDLAVFEKFILGPRNQHLNPIMDIFGSSPGNPTNRPVLRL